MDNHPIPQDVTGFQFRLIGDMTIKQFAYLATGVVLAWICLSLPLFVLIKFPLIVFFGGFGALLAFIPVAGRPADTMIFYFLKAVFSPTQYAYQQTPQQQAFTAVDNNTPAPQKEDEKKDDKVQLAAPVSPSSFDALFGEKKKEEEKEDVEQMQPQITMQAVEPSQEQPIEDTTILTKELQEAKKEEGGAKDAQEAIVAHQKVTDLEKELQSIQEQKQQLEEKLLQLQKQMAQKPQEAYAPSAIAEPKVTENVRKVPPSLSKSIGAPFVGDAPNLISGIVKDSRGNVLPNILIEVTDKDGNPVRAFKTNPLGQFASATPVISGTYTLTFEDPNGKQRFDTIELSATGEVMQPLEVISIDAREDLRKELFG